MWNVDNSQPVRIGPAINKPYAILADHDDPREFRARGEHDIKWFSWRGAYYQRDDLDTTTPDSMGMAELESDTKPLCVVSADGCRFKRR